MDEPTVAPDNPGAKPQGTTGQQAEAAVSREIRSAAEKALASQRIPAPDASKAASPEPAKPEGADVREFPRLLNREEPKQEAPTGIDPTKLPPELQAIYKEMQADYTRKTQDLADQRRQNLDEREKWLERVSDKLRPQEPSAPAPEDPLATIRQLREEGRHDEADAMLMKVSEDAAAKRLEVLERGAKVAELKATFRDVVSDVNMNNKLVGAYKEDVAKVFDGDHPVMKDLRAFAVSSPERIKTIVPAMMHFLALEQHALRLERELDARVKSGIEAGIKAEKDAARRVPGGRLVDVGGESKTAPAPPTSGNVRDVVRASLTQLMSG